MKIGFAIISHRTPDIMFENLLKQLNRFPDKQIIVHHDFSQSDFSNELAEKYNIEFCKKSYKTAWCSFTVVEATFDCIKQFKNVDWIILLSANDYPIKNPETIIDFLSGTTYNAFMEGTETINNSNEWELANWTYNMVFKKTLFKIPSLDKKGKFKWRPIKVNRSNAPFNDKYKLYFGSQWFMIDMKVAEYLTSIDVSNNPVVKFLSTAEKCKDEIVFQTLVHNQPNFKISEDNHRYINWENMKNWHPNTLTKKHWEAVQQSDALFARKFTWNESKELIDLIDTQILHKQS